MQREENTVSTVHTVKYCIFLFQSFFLAFYFLHERKSCLLLRILVLFILSDYSYFILL